MARQLNFKEAKQRAGRFCAVRERSPNEVFQKVTSWGLTNEESDRLVAELSKEGYVDEQRFANAFCHDKFEFNSWGKQKIKAGIYPHRLSDKIIQEALDRIDPDKYESRLFELATQKWGRLEKENDPMKKKQKVVNYLANKGFELDLIWKTLSLLEKKGH